MSAGAIQLTLEALRARLQRALGTDWTAYIGPPDDKDAQQDAVSVLLVRAAPSSALRNEPRYRMSAGPGQGPELLEGAVPLDLTLLICVASPTTGGEAPSLGALGAVVQVLAADPAIGPEDVPGQDARLSMEPTTTDELSRIWTMFPNTSYRPSLLYLLTPVWIDPRQPAAPAAPVVVDRRGTGFLSPREPAP